jgi:hypothetical protein
LNGRWYATVAGARGGVGDESAVRARKRLDRFPRSLEPLPESGRLQLEGIRRRRCGQIQDFAEY